MKAAPLTGGRKLEKEAMAVEFRGFGMATKKSEYAEFTLHKLKEKPRGK